MKSLIKSSFMLIILMAVFNIGVNNAYAEKAEASEANTIENVNAYILKCSIKSVLSSTLIGNNVNINLMPECEPKTFRQGNYVLIVRSDCSVSRVEIDPTSPVSHPIT